jgi:hypothetical protein
VLDGGPVPTKGGAMGFVRKMKKNQQIRVADVAEFFADKLELFGKSTVACSFCGRMTNETNIRSGGPEGDFRWDYCEFCDEMIQVKMEV